MPPPLPRRQFVELITYGDRFFAVHPSGGGLAHIAPPPRSGTPPMGMGGGGMGGQPAPMSSLNPGRPHHQGGRQGGYGNKRHRDQDDDDNDRFVQTKAPTNDVFRQRQQQRAKSWMD
eukprot:8385096-Pyramimonas_sp.AAC.1